MIFQFLRIVPERQDETETISDIMDTATRSGKLVFSKQTKKNKYKMAENCEGAGTSTVTETNTKNEVRIKYIVLF